MPLTVAFPMSDHRARDGEPSTRVLEVADALAIVGPDPGHATATGSGARDRWAMRELAGATGRADIIISRRTSRRPRLDPPYPELAVSLSATAGRVLAGFSPSRAVGVDIELLDASLDCSRFAADHYTAAEASAIAAADRMTALDLCYRLWVAKEAALKISGRGVFDGLDQPHLAHVLDALSIDGHPVHATIGTPPTAIIIVTRRWIAPCGGVYFVALAVTD